MRSNFEAAAGFRCALGGGRRGIIMAHRHTDPAPSTAAIRGHPIHPMLIPFPLAFLVGVLLTDLAYWATSDPFWARASLWLVGAGVVSGLVAAVFRSEEHTSELQSLMRISYAVFCLKKKNTTHKYHH